MRSSPATCSIAERPHADIAIGPSASYAPQGDARAAFVAALRALRRDARVALVLTLRADFYASLMESALWTDLDGFAKDLDAVVDFYDQRFNLKLTRQDHSDLVAFLRSL